MMEHRDDDKWHDEALRRILETPLGGDGSWAEPGERVWEGVSRSLGKRERKRRALGWWFGSLSALFLIIWLSLGEELRNDPGSVPQELAFNPAVPRRDPTAAELPRMESLSDERSAQHSATSPGQEALSSAMATTAPNEGPFLRSGTSKGRVSKGAEAYHESGMDLTPEGEQTKQLVKRVAIYPGDSVGADIVLREVVIAALERKASSDYLPTEIPDLPVEVAMAAETRNSGTHRLSIYGHGTAAAMDWQHRRPNLPGPPFFMDDALSQRFDNLRLGLGWDWQHPSGWFLASGLEYQSIRAETERALPWRFTRMGGMPGPGGFSQNLALSLSGGFGSNSADLRISVRELQNTQDYQEGDSVRLSLHMRQRLQQVRIPLQAGYRIGHRSFFGEIKAGFGMQVNVGFDAELTRLRDDRNRLGLLAPVPLRRSPQLAAFSLDLQAGAAVGCRLGNGLEWTIGWDGWRVIGAAVRSPMGHGVLQGSGVTTSVRWQLPSVKKN